MTHAHHEPAGGEAVRDEALLLRAADLERHLQRVLVAAAVQQTVQRADRRRQGRGRRRQRRGHDARSERAGVEAVIELQDLRDLERGHLLGWERHRA